MAWECKLVHTCKLSGGTYRNDARQSARKEHEACGCKTFKRKTSGSCCNGSERGTDYTAECGTMERLMETDSTTECGTME